MNNIFTYIGLIISVIGFVGLVVGDKNIALIFIMIGILIMAVQTVIEYFI